MNLEESDKFAKEIEARNRKKRMVLISIILCAVLIAFLFVLILFIKYQDSLILKVFVDGTRAEISSSLFTEIDGNSYVNAREIAKILDCTYTKGDYGKFNENENSGYISSNHEAVAIEAESKTMTKYILNSEEDLPEEVKQAEEEAYGVELTVKSENETKEVFTLEHPAKLIEGNLYIPFEILPDVFNVQINTEEKNRVRIYTLPTLYTEAKNVASQLGYTNITGEYENIRALVYGFIVVGNQNNFGVINLRGEEVISVKYSEIEFIQNVQEFFVYAANTIGLLSSEGDEIITPTAYDDISVLNAEKQLYLVQKNGKYGVLNRQGEVVIHAEYDQIGLEDENGTFAESEFADEIDDPTILFDTCIPVKLGAKYGLFDIEGNELAKAVYDGLGCVLEDEENTSSTSEDDQNAHIGEAGVLVLPESTGIQGIVINQNGGYGVYDVLAKRIIVPTVCTRIYSVTRAGETTYYMEFNGMQLEVSEYMRNNNLVSVKEDTEEDTAITNGNEVPTENTATTEENSENTTGNETEAVPNELEETNN